MSLHYVDCLWHRRFAVGCDPVYKVLLLLLCYWNPIQKNIAQTSDIKCFAQIVLDATFMSLIPLLVDFCTG